MDIADELADCAEPAEFNADCVFRRGAEEIARLREEVKTARRDALMKAATLCDRRRDLTTTSARWVAGQCADDIRAALAA